MYQLWYTETKLITNKFDLDDNVQYRMSGTDVGQENAWFWAANGAPFSYSNWWIVQPDSAGGNEQCIRLEWHQLFCQPSLYFYLWKRSINKWLSNTLSLFYIWDLIIINRLLVLICPVRKKCSLIFYFLIKIQILSLRPLLNIAKRFDFDSS